MNRSPHTSLSLAVLLSLAACSTGPVRSSDDAERSRDLQQLAQSVMTDSGNVSVKVEGNEAFVFGFVESALDALSILKALESAEGIETVHNGIQREM